MSTQTTMPEWVQKQLIADGALDRNGRGGRAIIHTCRRCPQAIVDGWDGTGNRQGKGPSGLFVTCDPIPLNPLGEALARLGGRYVLQLERQTGRLELHDRDSHPAGTSRCDVVTEHRCGWPPMPANCRAPTQLHPRLVSAPIRPGADVPAPF